MKPETRICPNCGDKIQGRSDKKFCSAYCKSNYHYQKTKDNESTLFKTIDKQLKKNRRILKEYNKSGKSTVRKSKLIELGFNPSYITNYWKSNTGGVYLFCYEYGFMEKMEHGKAKLILITWQDYMKSGQNNN